SKPHAPLSQEQFQQLQLRRPQQLRQTLTRRAMLRRISKRARLPRLPPQPQAHRLRRRAHMSEGAKLEPLRQQIDDAPLLVWLWTLFYFGKLCITDPVCALAVVDWYFDGERTEE